MCGRAVDTNTKIIRSQVLIKARGISCVNDLLSGSLTIRDLRMCLVCEPNVFGNPERYSHILYV